MFRHFFKEIIGEKYIFETGFLLFSDSFIIIMVIIFSLPIEFKVGTIQGGTEIAKKFTSNYG